MENGSIYIFKPWVLKELNNRLGGKISLLVMDESQSWEIDSLEDFEYIEFLINHTHKP
jgi:N-acylneuraminate cytidylyltransferase